MVPKLTNLVFAIVCGTSKKKKKTKGDNEMTIGIGAYGPHAGEAVFEALQHVERATLGEVGSGSIYGFAVYTVITQDGKMITYTTQRGGTTTLVTSGEEVGLRPGKSVLEARVAGIISSGPNRPEPLTSLLAAKASVGLVTGHRIPNALCIKTKQPVNSRVLLLMEQGMKPQDAVNKVINEDNSHIDAGLIAVNLAGEIGVVNSQRILKRADLNHSRAEDKVMGSIVEVINNEIFPPKAVGDLAAAIAINTMTREREPDFFVTVKSGTMVEKGDEDRVDVDANMVASKIYTIDHYVLEGGQLCVIPYAYSKVYKDEDFIGILMSEPVTVLKDGLTTKLCGRDFIEIPAKHVR